MRFLRAVPHAIKAIVLTLIGLLPPTVPAAAQVVVPDGALVIRGGWLFDAVSDAVRRNTGIVVVAGKIFAVDATLAAGPVPNARQVLELDDEAYVLPGFIDLHAHYNVNLFGGKRRDETTVQPVVFLANGVTTTFPAGEYDPEDMQALRLRIERGETPGPRLMNSGAYFGSTRPGWNPEMTAADVYADVDKWVARGVRGFKAKGIGPGPLKALIERAHFHGATVTGHLDSGFRGSVNPRDAILMGIDRIEHFMGGDAMPATQSAYASYVNLDLSSKAVKDVMQLFIDRRVNFDATMTAFGYASNRDELFEKWSDERRFLAPYAREEFDKKPAPRINDQFDRIYRIKPREIKQFYDMGGGHLITSGTDYPSTGEFLPGFSTHREIHAFARAGIPNHAALKIATINNARAFGLGDRLGSVEPGKFADLVIVRGNPLREIRNTRNVQQVIKGGQVYEAAALLKSVEGKLGPATAAQAAEWR